MAPTNPRGDEDLADYERLRHHLQRPPLEHPVAGQHRAAPARSRLEHPATGRAASAISVLDWLLAIGHAVVRRLRGAPRSPMVPLHPRK
jgi:hypothetical protein